MFENKITNYEAKKIMNDYQKPECANNISYVPHIVLTGTAYLPGQTISGRVEWNFTRPEAEAWLVIQTKSHNRLMKVDPSAWAFHTKIIKHNVCDGE